MKNNRDQWIEVVKGIGILSIVIGHITDGLLREVLFLFHVPLFFFLSGYLYKQPITINGFFTKKFKALIIPYVSFLTLFVSLLIIKGLSKSHELDLELIFNALWGGQAITGELSVFWFITSLFFTQIAFALIESYSDKAVLMITMLISLLLAYTMESYMQGKMYFLAINTLLYTLPFYYVGYMYNKCKCKLIDWLCFLYTIFLMALFYFTPEIFYIDIKNFILGIPVLSYLLSISLSIIVFRVVQKVSVKNKLSNAFVVLGSMSMTIMYVHQPIQITLKHSFQLHNQFYLILVTILLSVICHYLLSSTRLSRQYFLGGR